MAWEGLVPFWASVPLFLWSVGRRMPEDSGRKPAGFASEAQGQPPIFFLVSAIHYLLKSCQRISVDFGWMHKKQRLSLTDILVDKNEVLCYTFP